MKTTLAAAVLMTLLPLLAEAQSVESLILRAGNADTDTERLAVLRELRALPGLDARLAEDTDRLIAEVERYLVSPRLDYFSRPVRDTQDYDFGIAGDSPLFPITQLYRARMLCWVTLEYGGLWKDPEIRRAQFDLIRPLFEACARAFPENRLVRMYLGTPWPAEQSYTASPAAPEWANHQRESLERLSDIIHWWIDNRLQEDGQYGGGWGDDCEMWRVWTPVLLGFDDPKITAAQAFFSRALLSQPHMAGGYTDRMSDVEHTAEDSADVLTPMMHLEPENPEWRDRALRLVDLFENLWTGRNARGGLQFRSIYFTSERVDASSYRAFDTPYHPRAMQPALLYWQRTGDERLGELFGAWMDTWVEATARTANGKPAGIVPVGIHWPDGAFSDGDGPWWNAQHKAADPLYRWPSAMDLQLNTLLLSHLMSGEARYLEPIRSMAAIRLRHLDKGAPGGAEPGSEAWCAAQLGLLADVVGKYRLATGDRSLDALLERDATPYVRFRLSGDRSAFARSMAATAQALRINYQGYTSEVRYTDRVTRFPTIFAPGGMFPNGAPGIGVPAINDLYAGVSGDAGTPQICPVNAVRWRTPAREIAALVADSGKDVFVAELFHFGDSPREMGAELFLLAPGAYTWELGTDTARVASGNLQVGGNSGELRFTLPPGELCVLRVTPR